MVFVLRCYEDGPMPLEGGSSEEFREKVNGRRCATTISMIQAWKVRKWEKRTTGVFPA
jgi:hypothetical protein